MSTCLLTVVVEQLLKPFFVVGYVYNSMGLNDWQWDRLLDKVSGDDEMRQGFSTKPNGKFVLSEKWDNFALVINELGPAKKCGDKWKEVSTQHLISCWIFVHWCHVLICL